MKEQTIAACLCGLGFVLFVVTTGWFSALALALVLWSNNAAQRLKRDARIVSIFSAQDDD